MKRVIAALMLMSSAAFAHGSSTPVLIPIPVAAPAPVDDACGAGMSPAAFDVYVDRFRSAWYDNNRLTLLTQEKPVLSSAQLDRLLGEMDDDANRLSAVQLLAARLADPQNRFVFYRWFTTDAAQKALRVTFSGSAA